jgi:hypothetical protein
MDCNTGLILCQWIFSEIFIVYNSLMQIYCWPEATKRLARIILKEGIQQGKVKPPKRCQVCGRDRGMLLREKHETTDRFAPKASDSNRPIIAHHFNYLSPYNVWWLCNACHTDLHKFQRKYKCVVISIIGIKEMFNKDSEQLRRCQLKEEADELHRLRLEQAQLTIDDL